MLPTRKEPYALAKDEGPALWSVGLLVRLKATGEQTGGAFVLTDEVCPPGYATFLHVHHLEDEAFYVLEGNFTIFCGDKRVESGPGTFVYGPRDVPHGFRVEGPDPARLLIWSTPSGVEHALTELGEPVTALNVPTVTPSEQEVEFVFPARYQIEVLGPLPE